MPSIAQQFMSGLTGKKPWESIEDFTLHRSFLGYQPFPRQLTLLKLIFLETENMTPYDLDVIEGWRQGFGGSESIGVQPDIWERVKWLKDRGYRRFPHVQTVLGRRASKGWIGGIVGTEQLAYMISLDNWQQHYGIQPNKDGYLHVIATNEPQAIKFQFADIKQAVEDCKYLDPYKLEVKNHIIKLQTPSDLRYLAKMRARRLPVDREVATVRALAMASTSRSGRGATGFANFFDEFAHMISGTEGPASSEEVYEAYEPSLRQFGKDGLTYIPSSPFSKVGKFFSLYTTGSVMIQEWHDKNRDWDYREVQSTQLTDDPEETFVKITADPRMLIVQLPSWGLYEDWEKTRSLGLPYSKPQAMVAYDDEAQILERNNTTKFKVEYRAQFAEVEDAYLESEMVDRMFEDWQGKNIGEAAYGRLDKIYAAHADPGLSNANFGFCIAHLEESEDEDDNGNYWPHAVVDVLRVWQPKDFPDHRIDYMIVEQELRAILAKFPSLGSFTFDQWNSAHFISSFKRDFGQKMGVREVTFTKQENFKRAEKFKTAINQGWIHSHKDNYFNPNLGGGSLLEQELKFLTEKNGAIEKQDFGPVTTKDLADCVMEATTRLLTKALDHYRSTLMGENKPVFTGAATQRVVDSQARTGMMKTSPKLAGQDYSQGKVGVRMSTAGRGASRGAFSTRRGR